MYILAILLSRLKTDVYSLLYNIYLTVKDGPKRLYKEYLL